MIILHYIIFVVHIQLRGHIKLLRILEDYNVMLEINFGGHSFDVHVLLDVLIFHWWVCCLLHITFVVL